MALSMHHSRSQFARNIWFNSNCCPEKNVHPPLLLLSPVDQREFTGAWNSLVSTISSWVNSRKNVPAGSGNVFSAEMPAFASLDENAFPLGNFWLIQWHFPIWCLPHQPTNQPTIHRLHGVILLRGAYTAMIVLEFACQLATFVRTQTWRKKPQNNV